jgi:hypothetical protein
VNKNSQGDIIRVGIEDGRIFDVQQIIDDIRGGYNVFYTSVGGNIADVYAMPPNPHVNHWYLTTSRDGRLPNNLDFLVGC